MFHMPLFFFFAGYCFKDKYLYDFPSFAKNKLRGIYKPYVKWGLVFLIFHNVFFYLSIYSDQYGYRGTVNSAYSLQDFYQRVLLLLTMTRCEPLLGGYWFLKSLFWCSFIGYFFMKFMPKNHGIMLLLLITIFVSYLKINIPFFQIGKTEILAATFFLIGRKTKTSFLSFDLNLLNSIVFVLSSVICVTIGMELWQSTMKTVEWWAVIPYVITALIGTAAVFVISKHICQINNSITKLFVYIGNNTLTILTWHFLSFKLISLIIVIIYGLPIARLGEHPTIEEYAKLGWFLAYLLTGISIPLAFSKCKYLK